MSRFHYSCSKFLVLRMNPLSFFMDFFMSFPILSHLKLSSKIIIFVPYVIFRNDQVAQEIIEQIQKLLNTRRRQNAMSAGNVQEYVCIGEEHFRRSDFKKAVMCYSLVNTIYLSLVGKGVERSSSAFFLWMLMGSFSQFAF